MTTQQIENPPVYDAAYFIAKFEAIPEEDWITGVYERDGKCCAFGHCGMRQSGTSLLDRGEREALFTISTGDASAMNVNDGNVDAYQQKTPKQRVLAWLRDAQKAGL